MKGKGILPKRGFGLLELIIVLAILCVLGGGGWYFTGLQNKKSAVETGLDAVQQAQQVANQAAFPVPALYGGYAWRQSTSSYRAVYLSSASVSAPAPTLNFTGALTGQLFQATNTDPAATDWRLMDAAAPPNEPEGFYSGDRALLVYYDQTLRAVGYQTSPLNIDKTYVLGPLAADGPEGTIRGYIKYSGDKIRAVIIASDSGENQVFISDVIAVKDIVSVTKP